MESEETSKQRILKIPNNRNAEFPKHRNKKSPKSQNPENPKRRIPNKNFVCLKQCMIVLGTRDFENSAFSVFGILKFGDLRFRDFANSSMWVLGIRRFWFS